MRHPRIRRAVKVFIAVAWAAVLVIRDVWHPAWGGYLSDGGATLVAAGMLALTRTSGCRHYLRHGWHAIERPGWVERVTFTRAMLAGCALGVMALSVATGDLPRLDAMWDVGRVLVLGCPCALILKWGFGRRRAKVTDISEAPSVAHQVAANAGHITELRERVDRHAIHLHGLYRIVMDLAGREEDGEDSGEDSGQTEPLPRISLAWSAPRDGGGAQTGLCAVRGRALVLSDT